MNITKYDVPDTLLMLHIFTKPLHIFNVHYSHSYSHSYSYSLFFILYSYCLIQFRSKPQDAMFLPAVGQHNARQKGSCNPHQNND